ncbi:MAG: hypothetical protein NVSMB64_27130 [Candidatus Velthaea sp.]
MQHSKAAWIWIPTALVIVWQLLIVVEIFLPHWAVGIDLSGARIVSVRPGMPVERAGIRVGDELVLDDSARALIHAWVIANLEEHPTYPVTVHRGQMTIKTTVTPALYPFWRIYPTFRLWDHCTAALVFIVSIVLAAWLVSVRPGLMTYAFYYAMLQPMLSFYAVQPFHPDVRLAIETIQFAAFGSATTIALLIFALRFPDDRAPGGRLWAQRAAIVLFFAVAAMEATDTIARANSFVGLTQLVLPVWRWTQVTTLLLTLGILVSQARGAVGIAKARLRWGLIGVSSAILVAAFTTALPQFHDYWWYGPYGAAIVATDAFALVLPISIVYVLICTRFIDPRFTINRAAVVSVTGSLLIVAVVAFDWLTSRFLFKRGLNEVVDGAFAITLGFFAYAIHHRIAKFVERLVFKAKYRAEARLREIGQGLRYTNSPDAVYDVLVFEAVEQLGLASAALFRRDHAGKFTLYRGKGWPDSAVQHFDEDDKFVRSMRAARTELALDEWRVREESLPRGVDRPRVALPLFHDDEIVGICFYSDHSDHTIIDSSEIEILKSLTERAAAALDRLDSATLRQELSALRASLPSLSIVAETA